MMKNNCLAITLRNRFPLTPALSPGERGNRRQSVGKTGVDETFVRLTWLFPLPAGEGQGEGRF
jgi:hypothetical protein